MGIVRSSSGILQPAFDVPHSQAAHPQHGIVGTYNLPARKEALPIRYDLLKLALYLPTVQLQKTQQALQKGDPAWGLPVKQGTTLYLCLEDSQLRIQNRLFDVTEDAPPSVHFCTESRILGDGLEERLRQFLTEHSYTSPVIIDTLQMIPVDPPAT